MKSDRPIGIFDSGLGGLTVVKEITKILPDESIIYFGDTARVPYGTKSKKTIEKFSLQNTRFLTKSKVKLIVVACNTSSSLALNLLKRTFKIPITGVIEPGVKQALLKTKNERVGVIGTRATISSGVYQKALTGHRSKVKVFALSCPLFVPLVEEGWLNKKITRAIVYDYLEPLVKKKIDTLILACTHYPLIKSVIAGVMGPRVGLIDSAASVAAEVRRQLIEKGLRAGASHGSKYQFFVSDEPRIFSKEGSKFLGRKIINIKRINNV